MLNLDTHILLYALNDELTSKERALLEKEQWSISAIVWWEISKLSQLGRIEANLDDADVQRALSQIYVWPIDLQVSLGIRQLDFQSDPADELIAATSLVRNVPLVTRDQRIRKSKKIPLAM